MTEQRNTEIDLPWAGGVYWPLRRWGLFVNHLSLFTDCVELASPPPQIAKDRSIRIYTQYHNYFRLLSGGQRLLEGEWPTAKVKVPKLFTEALETLKETFDKVADSTELLVALYPQHSSVKLLLSQPPAEGLKRGEFLDIFEPTPSNSEEFSPLEAFYVYAEPFLWEKYKDDSNTIANHEVFQLQQIRDALAVSFDSVSPVFFQGSFFADGVRDYVYCMFLRKEDEERDKTRGLVRDAVLGLSRLIFDERRAWLYRWIQRLPQAMIEHAKESRTRMPERDVLKSARVMGHDALTSMTALLLDLGPRSDLDLGLTNLPPSQHGKRDHVENILKNKISTIEPVRVKWLGQFLLSGIAAIDEIETDRSLGKLRGLLSLGTSREISHVAQFQPPNARVMLLGSPGGGKGAASADFHLAMMRRLSEDDSDSRPSARQKLLGEVAKRIAKVFFLPHLFSAKVDEIKVGFYREIQGTGWWSWRGKKDGPCVCCAHLLPANGTANKNCANGETCLFDKGGDLSETWESIDKILVSLRTFGHQQEAGNLTKSYLAYLWRQLGRINAQKTQSEMHETASFNLVQINCGALAGDGDGIVTSLRLLFGYADDEGNSVPGLFQTCAYMGGTLFLDEIADAPMAIQDNLLMALEEGKVNRLGWETVKEDVGNVRIVTATHKDLRKEVKRFHDSAGDARRVGFRPDLLSRLARTVPIQVTAVSDYFVHDESDPLKRDQLREGFVEVMLAMAQAKNPKRSIYSFYRRVYDLVDRYVGEEARRRFAFEDAGTEVKRKRIAGNLTARLFVTVTKMYREAEGKGEELDRVEGYVLGDFLRRMLVYLSAE